MNQSLRNCYERYGYYRVHLEKIGQLRLGEDVKIKDLGLSRGAVQRAYREMEAECFYGNLRDFLVWIGAMFMLTLWIESFDGEESQPITPQRATELIVRVMDQRPGDALLLLRAVEILRFTDILELMPEGELALFELPYKFLRKVWMDLFLHKPSLNNKENTVDTTLPNLTRYYLKLQSVTPGFEPSFLSTTTKQPITPTTQSSDQPKAERSEASSQKAPSGAAKKGRRTTRPSSKH